MCPAVAPSASSLASPPLCDERGAGRHRVNKQFMTSATALGAISLCAAGALHAQDTADSSCDDACMATRNSQDPTASINGVFTDNTIGLGPNGDSTFYDLQIQPVATVLNEDWGSLVLRGIVPVLGVPVPDGAGGLDTETGISDTVLQAFYVPRSDGAFTYGVGAQVSLATHTDSATQGAGWGGGPAFGGFGFAGPVSYGGLVSHLWGEDDFSRTTIQPIVYYNVEHPTFGPWYFGYNAQITYDWSADDDPWQVPLGLSVGKTVLNQSGYAVNYLFGAYDLIESPENGNDWQFRFAISVLFP